MTRFRVLQSAFPSVMDICNCSQKMLIASRNALLSLGELNTWENTGKNHTLCVGGIQITDVDLKSQNDSHGEKTVGFEDRNDLVVVCGGGLEDILYSG